MPDDLTFEILAAGLRHNHRDVNTYLEVMAKKFLDALPEATTVNRRGGLFTRDRSILSLTIELGDLVFQLEKSAGSLIAKSMKRVRGVTLKTEEIPLEQWVAALTQHLLVFARSHNMARETLERFLLEDS